MNEYAGTKLDLIIAAGELFADNGVEGTSVRAIAERCGANIAAINYHFGGKENLYTEVLRYVMMQTRCPLASELVKEDAWFATSEKKATAIRMLIKERFTQYFGMRQPNWFGRLLMLSLVYPTPSLEIVVREMMFPENAAFTEVLRRCKPGLAAEEAQFWVISIEGQISFYVFAESGILLALNRPSYDDTFLKRIEKHIGDLMLKALDLPLIDMAA